MKLTPDIRQFITNGWTAHELSKQMPNKDARNALQHHTTLSIRLIADRCRQLTQQDQGHRL